MPPIARLSEAQARYHFLSGFTARLAGTEIGVTEPAPVFSPCFGGPFLPQPPAVYARLLQREAARPPADGVAREHGLDRRARRPRRPPDADPRRRARCSHAALSGELENAEMRIDPVFGFEVPVAAPGRRHRAARSALDLERPAAYDAKAPSSRRMFRENFAQFADVDPEVAAAGPRRMTRGSPAFR